MNPSAGKVCLLVGENKDLVMVGLSTLLIPLIMQVIFIIVLFVNIYFFSEKIFHLAAYKRIL